MEAAMDHLMAKVQTEFEYTDYQIKLIRYALTSILYDVSKALIFLVYFAWTGRLFEYLCALVPMILLRTKTGGLHMRTYWSCFFFSFLYLETAITILPALIPIHELLVYPILITCAIITYKIGPVTLQKKPMPDEILTKKLKIQSFQVVGLVGIMYFLFRGHSYLEASFWVVVLHTIQLTITKLIKEVKTYEKLA